LTNRSFTRRVDLVIELKTSKVVVMFRSVTIRLTGWFLLILMTISILFSVILYQVATNEVEMRLNKFQTSIQIHNFGPATIETDPIRTAELSEAQSNLSIELIYVNLVILVVGGIVSYFLARWHLAPIEKAHEAQSRFTSDASHELRTPLAVMKTEIEVALRDKSASVGDLHDVLTSNLEEVDKLTKLSEMLLNLSRLDSDKIKLESINLNKITKEIIKDFSQPESRIAVYSKKQQIIKGNEMAIADLFKILIDNAMKYSPKDSQINIELYNDNHNTIFKISNTGPGIKPEKLPHVFERFFRADDSRTCGDCKGYGLGLALAKKIAEIHNGMITVESIPDNLTTFSVFLPTFHNTQAKSKN